MKKNLALILSVLLLLAMLAGCGAKQPNASPSDIDLPSNEPVTSPEEESLGTIRLATLKGPTSMGLIKLLDDDAAGTLSYDVENTIYGAADEITALLVGGELDMAAIPCNLASTLYNKTSGKLQIAAVNTLGVLYVLELGDSVSSIEDLKGKTVYSTGKGTTPEYTLNAILSANGIDPDTDLTLDFKSEATEIAAMLTGDTAVTGTVAVLPQPYATTVLMNNPDARIALSLNEEWTKAGLDGKPVTGVLVVNSDFAAANPELVSSFLSDYNDSVTWVNENNEAAAELIAAAEIVPKAAVAVKALPYCSIVFESGADMKADVSAYLEVLFAQESKSVGGALPDDNFYCGA